MRHRLVAHLMILGMIQRLERPEDAGSGGGPIGQNPVDAPPPAPEAAAPPPLMAPPEPAAPAGAQAQPLEPQHFEPKRHASDLTPTENEAIAKAVRDALIDDGEDEGVISRDLIVDGDRATRVAQLAASRLSIQPLPGTAGDQSDNVTVGVIIDAVSSWFAATVDPLGEQAIPESAVQQSER